MTQKVPDSSPPSQTTPLQPVQTPSITTPSLYPEKDKNYPLFGEKIIQNNHSTPPNTTLVAKQPENEITNDVRLNKVSELLSSDDTSDSTLNSIEQPIVHTVTPQKQIPQDQQIKLNKIEKFVVKHLSIFKPILTKQRIMLYSSALQLQSKMLVQTSTDKIHNLRQGETSANYQPNVKNATETYKIPEHMVVHIKSYASKSLKAPEQVSDSALKEKVHESVKPFNTSVGELKGYRFDDTKLEDGPPFIVLNEITPTSYLGASKKHEKESSHLTNVYSLVVDGKDYAIIRTGKIDTQQKADEFVQMIETAQKEIALKTGKKDFQMRVVSQQLNSFEVESKIIDAQHKWIEYANDKMQRKKLGEVIHINLPSNRWYHWTKAIGKIPVVGALFTSKVGKGERLSKEQNIDSWNTYVKWADSDLQKLLPKDMLEKGNLFQDKARNNCQDEISGLTASIRIIESRINNNETELKSLNDKLKVHSNLPKDQLIREKNQKLNIINQNTNTLKEMKDTLSIKRQEMKKYLVADHAKLISLESRLGGIVENEKITYSPLYLKAQTELTANREALIKTHANIGKLYEEIGEINKEISRLNTEITSESKIGITPLYAKLEELKSKTESLESEKGKAQEIEKEITHLEAKFKIIENEPDHKLLKAYQIVTLLRQVLGTQLDIPGEKLDRGQEGMTILMLNDKLGITSAMNCKSGLDRTGFWHATKLAMQKFENHFGPVKSMRLVTEWNSTTKLLNRLYANAPLDDVNKWLNATSNEERAIIPSVHKIVSAEYEDAGMKILTDQMKDVIEFRKMVLDNLLEIGIPITDYSTGVMGLKWNTGMEENRIPLNFIPPFVTELDAEKNIELTRNAEQSSQPVVKYDKETGSPQKMTNIGRQFLTIFQSFRKS